MGRFKVVVFMRAISAQTSDYSVSAPFFWREDGVDYMEKVLDVSLEVELNSSEAKAMLRAHNGDDLRYGELKRLLPEGIDITRSEDGRVSVVATAQYRRANSLHSVRQTKDHVIALLEGVFRSWGC
jgi:hypothetical protein